MKNPADNPHQIGIAPPIQGGDDGSSKLFYARISKEEEEKAHDHRNLPYTIQTLIQQIGDVFVKLVDIRGAVAKTKDLPFKNKDNKDKAIKQMQSKIDEINKEIFSLTNYLNELNLDK